MDKTYSSALDRLGIEPAALKGEVVVVTGSGRGIGREIALLFSLLGASVVIAEISDEGLETEMRIREAGGRALFIRTDVSSKDNVTRLEEKVREAFGPASILINNAILVPVAPVLEMDVDLWDRVMAVNLRGTFLTCKAFLPGMLANQRGTIVNMVSTDAMPQLSAYIASKQGITGFSQSLAAEVGEQGVRVVAFAPGFVRTPGLESAADMLAPALGFSRDQFLNMSFHPGYEGAMPVEDAALATAYLVVARADEFHGETANGFDLLEQAGYLKRPVFEAVYVEPSEAPTVPGGERIETLKAAIQLSAQLLKAIEQTETEFNKLPVFVRPMARGGFKGKAGQSLQEWKRAIPGLAEQLRLAVGDPAKVAAVRGDCLRWQEQLTRLIEYYQGVPAETARFTKDVNLLREVSRLTNERVGVIKGLLEALAKV